MSKSIRIRTDIKKFDSDIPTDKFIKVPIDQDFDFIEILSLKISQDDVYPQHCADYGVLVGRVTVNGGLGVPNAKVSIFIPLSTEDESNPIISSIYPFKTVLDKDTHGIRYNLLPKNKQGTCHQPVGTFPSKREILDDNTILEIFEKYYKYTTVTNNSGDYMICGVPAGNQYIHIDVDLSDIGILSQKPYDMIRSGISAEAFASPTKFSKGNDLAELHQIITQNSSIDIIPFWGDLESCEVGINRFDFDLPYRIEPIAFFVGSVFSDSKKNSLNKNCRPQSDMGEICKMVTGDGLVEILRKTPTGQNEYLIANGSDIDENGAWVVEVPMNNSFKITDEFGNLVDSEDSTVGIATTTKVRFRIGPPMTASGSRMRMGAKYLVPNNPPLNVAPDYTYGNETLDLNNNFTELKWNNIYTVRNFIPRFQTSLIPTAASRRTFTGIKNVDDCASYNEFPYNRVDTNGNRLYAYLCQLATLLVTLISIINMTLIFILNWSIVWILNKTLSLICVFIRALPGDSCTGQRLPPEEGEEKGKCICACTIGYIPPITVKCNERLYAPGAYALVLSGAWLPGDAEDCPKTESGDGTALDYSTLAGGSDEYLDCVTVELADSLNVFKFDFYNDWVNGGLYSFMFKYKKVKKGGHEKFCNVDCDESQSGVAWNNCQTSYLVDTCKMDSCSVNCGDKATHEKIKIGLVKQVNDNLYYASATRGGGFKLFATDVTLLGNVNECNFFGYPRIYQYLESTTYQLPPVSVDETEGAATEGTIDPMLIDVRCPLVPSIATPLIRVNETNCKNLRLICELGRGSDELRYDGSGTAYGPDNKIDSRDIDFEYPRKALRHMNVVTQTNDEAIMHNAFRGYVSNFGMGDGESYNCGGSCTTVAGAAKAGLPYNNSYYFYFGLIAGATSLDVLRTKYLPDCETVNSLDFVVSYSSTPPTNYGTKDGSITVTVEGNVGSYYMNMVGLNSISTTNNLTVGVPYVVSNLDDGLYYITVYSSNSNITTFNIKL